MEKLYNEVFSLEKSQVERIQKDIAAKYNTSLNTFQNADDKEKEFLQFFSFICLLSFDVYVKKQLIEKLIDGMGKETAEKPKEKE